MSTTVERVDISDLVPMLGTQYSIKIRNESQLDGHNAVVFQTSPNLPKDAHTLAWLSKMCHPYTRVNFTWTLQYNFVWGQQGVLRPGADYEAGQEIDADLTADNVISLSYINDGFTFHSQGKGKDGSLVINEDDSVPGAGNRNQGCVGIGMSGFGTFVAPTQPDYRVQFDPHPSYWIGLGRYTPGVVVDTAGMTKPKEVAFPVGATNADCVFDGKGWRIDYS